MKLDRRTFVAAAGAVALAGCSEQGATAPDAAEGSSPGSAESATPTKVKTATNTASQTKSPAEAADAEGLATPTRTPTERARPGDLGGTPPTRDDRLPLPMARSALRSAAQSGGPRKDGIPSIDSPTFVDAETASDELADGDVVFGLARNGDVRAYPQRILVKHEICSDTVGGQPVSVTYCPLTGTVQGFERGETTFGVSGRLINNNLVMYDRDHEIWWPQVLASSIPGPWNESPAPGSLREFRLIWTTWGRWRDHYPDTRVLSEDTGHVRNYDNDPYGTYNPKGGYYAQSSTLFPALNPDDTFGNKRVVLGARTPTGAAAFLKDSLREAEVMTGEIDGESVVAVNDARLDTGYVYRNPEGKDVGVDGEEASVDGAAQKPDELPLERIHTFDAMWFAWHGFYPETNVYQ